LRLAAWKARLERHLDDLRARPEDTSKREKQIAQRLARMSEREKQQRKRLTEKK
jgi:hypothetical protein